MQLTKTTKSRTSSTYHFVTGVDVSSAASIAAYLTTLTTKLGEYQLWFDRAPQWKVTEGTFCSWNVFSRVDVRVSATFPGSTKMYLITADGMPHDPPEDDKMLWHELFMSGMMRALLRKDDDMYYMERTRHEFPLTPSGVDQFFQSFEQLYARGALSHASSLVQVPNASQNYMVDSLYRLLDITGQHGRAIEMLTRIEATEVLTEVLVKADYEVSAVQLLVQGVETNARNANLLAQEAEFCLHKNEPDLALDCAKRAVNAAPSDFYSWHVLCLVYLQREQWDQVLLALNSAPIIPFVGMDTQRMAEEKKVHTPLPTDGVLEEAWQSVVNKSHPVAAQAMAVQPALARLPGAQLRGCQAMAYSVLATLNAKLGWSALMKLRSDLFWMDVEPNEEDESDTQKTKTEIEGHRTLRSKRLCERRVDRLFMILFEDVRFYSSWVREAVHKESQKLPLEKSAYEWQFFGALAERLHYLDQAKAAYSNSLNMFFNHKSLQRLLRFDPYDLEIAVKLAAWLHRYYNEFSPQVYESLKKIIAKDGLTKVRYQVEAVFGKQGIVKLVHGMLENLAALECVGYDM